MSEESGLHGGGPRRGRRARPGGRQHQRQPGAALVRHQPVRGRRATAPGPPSWSTRRAGCASRRHAAAGARVDGDAAARRSACTDDGRRHRGPVGLPASLVRLEAVPRPRCRWPSTCARWPAGRLDAYVDCSPSAHGAWDYLGGMLDLPGGGRGRRRRLRAATSSRSTTPRAAPRWRPAPRRCSTQAVAARRGVRRRMSRGRRSDALASLSGVLGRLHQLALEVFRRLPVRARRRVVRSIAPAYTVGADLRDRAGRRRRAAGAPLLPEQLGAARAAC